MLKPANFRFRLYLYLLPLGCEAKLTQIVSTYSNDQWANERSNRVVIGSFFFMAVSLPDLTGQFIREGRLEVVMMMMMMVMMVVFR